MVTDEPSEIAVPFTVIEEFTNAPFGIDVNDAPEPENNVAVIVPALKLPEASLATTLLTVFVLVASTAIVAAVDPLYDVPVRNEPNVNVAKLLPSEIPEIVLFANLLLAMEPANIVLVTVDVSPVVITVPVVAGNVIVLVPAIAAACNVTVPDVEPGNCTLEIPVNAWFALERFSATAVVPT